MVYISVLAGEAIYFLFFALFFFFALPWQARKYNWKFYIFPYDNSEKSQKVELVYQETFQQKEFIYCFSYMKVAYQFSVLYYVYNGAKVNHIGAMTMVLSSLSPISPMSMIYTWLFVKILHLGQIPNSETLEIFSGSLMALLALKKVIEDFYLAVILNHSGHTLP